VPSPLPTMLSLSGVRSMSQINSCPQSWPPGEVRPLPPPRWASRSAAEDGGIVHETTSPIRPTGLRWAPYGTESVVTDVTLSATDVLINGRWMRSGPTVQVEGSSLPLDGVRQLHAALELFLAAVAAEERPEADPWRRVAARRAGFSSLQEVARRG
jgi:hypothetical protein